MINVFNYYLLFIIPVAYFYKDPGLLVENTRVFLVQTPGSFGYKHPGVFR